jgi:type 1 glutamine amidotransferase
MTGAVAARAAAEDAPLRVLYVTKSEGFEHGPVAEIDGQPSHSQKIFDELASKHGWTLTTTKDAALVNAENLANYDVVMFYTQGDITQMGTKDQGKPMAPEGVQELLTWIENGGGFVAIHAGTDSFRTGDAETPSDYIAMVGGEFRTHGPQFVGSLKVVSPGHPVAAGQPEDWTVNEEWYLWRHLNAANMHVVATVDPGRARRALEDYDLPDYPMVWVSSHGKGRVYVNGMGHREDVWDHENFQNWLVNGIHWAAGQGEAMTTPNYHEHISADIDPRTGMLTEEAKANKEPHEKERLPRRERPSGE